MVELDASTFHCYFHFLPTLRSYLAVIFIGCELTTFSNKCVGALFLDNDISWRKILIFSWSRMVLKSFSFFQFVVLISMFNWTKNKPSVVRACHNEGVIWDDASTEIMILGNCVINSGAFIPMFLNILNL